MAGYVYLSFSEPYSQIYRAWLEKLVDISLFLARDLFCVSVAPLYERDAYLCPSSSLIDHVSYLTLLHYLIVGYYFIVRPCLFSTYQLLSSIKSGFLSRKHSPKSVSSQNHLCLNFSDLHYSFLSFYRNALLLLLYSLIELVTLCNSSSSSPMETIQKLEEYICGIQTFKNLNRKRNWCQGILGCLKLPRELVLWPTVWHCPLIRIVFKMLLTLQCFEVRIGSTQYH